MPISLQVRMDRVLDHIEQGLSGQLTLAEVAGVAHLSPISPACSAQSVAIA
jgi:hypothetical protein